MSRAQFFFILPDRQGQETDPRLGEQGLFRQDCSLVPQNGIAAWCHRMTSSISTRSNGKRPNIENNAGVVHASLAKAASATRDTWNRILEFGLHLNGRFQSNMVASDPVCETSRHPFQLFRKCLHEFRGAGGLDGWSKALLAGQLSSRVVGQYGPLGVVQCRPKVPSGNPHSDVS